MVEFEKLTGIGIFSGAFTLDSYEQLRALVFVGLKWGLYKKDGREPQPKFNLLTVGDWLDETPDQEKLFVSVLKAFAESQPKPETAKNSKAPEEGATNANLIGVTSMP
jgi:hypothetical protein